MCKECYKEYSLAYYRKYRKENPDKISKSTPEKVREYSAAAEARRKIKNFLDGKLTRYNHCKWPYKTCKKCGAEKLREDFYNSQKSKDGKSSYCKPCSNEKVKNYKHKNFDWEKARFSVWPRQKTKSYYKPKPKRLVLHCRYCKGLASTRSDVCSGCSGILRSHASLRFFSGNPSDRMYCTWPEKVCFSCRVPQDRENFHKYYASKDGHIGKCKSCYKEGSIRRKHDGRDVIPDWLPKPERKKLSKFYRDRPEGYHVDHIVPLRGKFVCGLHVPWNLQYLPAQENMEKSNLWWPNMW